MQVDDIDSLTTIDLAGTTHWNWEKKPGLKA
jgi:hypothetical protein